METQWSTIFVSDTTKEPDPDEEDETEFLVDTHANMENDDLHNKYLEVRWIQL